VPVGNRTWPAEGKLQRVIAPMRLCRIDPQRVVLAHPQLPAPVAEALGILRLEAAVLEVLDASEEPEALAEIQVPFCAQRSRWQVMFRLASTSL